VLRPYEKTNPESPLCANRGSFFADVFVPDGRIILDVIGEQSDAFLRVEIDDFNVEGAEPVDAALEGAGFADDDAGKTELANEAAAIPARRERRNHDRILVASLATGPAKRIGLAMHGRVVVLYSTVMTRADEFAHGIKDRSSDRDASFAQPFISFRQCHRQHCRMIKLKHDRDYIEDAR